MFFEFGVGEVVNVDDGESIVELMKICVVSLLCGVGV